MPTTYKISFTGQVQGVGFRPTVYNLAIACGLKGKVGNDKNGVFVHINASEARARSFMNEIIENRPEVSVILSHSIAEVGFHEFTDFKIVVSRTEAKVNLPLTPDFALCPSCKAEVADPKNKRFGYGFTTCTQCGPRYSITTEFPFERVHTAMRHFNMCRSCYQEYIDPMNPRFHSQTNSCPDCGPKMELMDAGGNVIEADDQQAILKKTAELISEGKIVALKNTNGYLLCCDANNAEIVQELRNKKRRPTKPFAVLYPSIETVKKEFSVSKLEERVLLSREAPIVILANTKNPKIKTNIIAPNLDQMGIMLPSSALLQLLMNELRHPIVATSGNIHGSPIISNKEEAQKSLQKVADYFLHHNLDIQFPQDDSVIKFSDGEPVLLRRSRGYAPNFIGAKKPKEAVLAMGAHLKSSFAFTPNAHTYVSPYFGNLGSYESVRRYEETIEKYVSLFDTVPSIILVDAHPNYQSHELGRTLAEKWNTDVEEIQHHKAHFASVLGEHDLFDTEDKVLGVIWDGTGLGEDKTIWGGEFFRYQDHQMERISHFGQFNWLANDRMATEARLSLFSLLPEEYRPYIQSKFNPSQWKIYGYMGATNKLKTTSVGRLFDAVASALDLCDTNTFEGEAAMILEQSASKYKGNDLIDFLPNLIDGNIPTKILMENLYKAKLEAVDIDKLAACFIYTLAKAVIKIAEWENVQSIACSGGVFQNALLRKQLSLLAGETNKKVLYNRRLSPNDENIAFGQLMYHQNISKPIKKKTNVFSSTW